MKRSRCSTSRSSRLRCAPCLASGARSRWWRRSETPHSRRKPRKHVVATLHTSFVAGEAGAMLGLVGRLAVHKATKSPAAGRGIFFGILNHHLDGGGLTRNRRRRKFGRLFPFPGALDQNCPVRERKLAALIGINRGPVADDGTQLVQGSRLFGRRDQLPLLVAFRDSDAEDRRGISLALRESDRDQIWHAAQDNDEEEHGQHDHRRRRWKF